jgi:hypothetical protein
VKSYLSLFLLLALVVKGQIYNTYNHQLTTNDGLPTNTIYSLFQSKKGVIYIGHEYGISRYNGKTFKNLKHKGRGRSLQSLVETDSETILASSFNGDLVALINDSISKLPYSNQEKSSYPIVRKIGHKVFVYEKHKLFEYRNAQLKSLKNVIDSESESFVDIGLDTDKQVVIALSSLKGLYIKKLNEKNEVIKTWFLDKIFIGRIQFIHRHNRLFIFSIRENISYQISGDKILSSKLKFEYDPLYTKWNSVEKIDSTTFAIIGFDGLLLFDENGKLKKHLLKGSQISSVIKDKEGNLWVGSLKEGVFIFPNLYISIASFDGVIDKTDFIHSSFILSDQSLLIGTFLGKLIHLSSTGEILQELQLAKRSEIQTITVDETSRKIYLYCDDIYKLDLKTFKVENQYPSLPTKDLIIKNNTFYLANSTNFSILKNDTMYSFFQNTWINNLLYDSIQKCIWLGSNKGLLKYDYDTRKESKLDFELNGSSNPAIRSICKDSKENLYFLAINLGVVKRDKNGNYSLFYKSDDFEKIKLNHSETALFVIQKKEVHFIDLKTGKRIYSFNINKGMDQDIIDFYQTGKEYLSVHSKFIKKYKSLIKTNKVSPLIQLSTINGSFGKDKLTHFTSDHTKNNIEFKIEILPNISTKNNFILKYKLSPLDDDWVYSELNSSEFTFKYQQLNSGTYKFEAIAYNEDGVASSPFLITLKVNPPFWKRWWFIVLILILSVLLIWFIYIWRFNILQKQALEREEKIRTKMKLLSAELTAIRSQMNPHFIFNTLSSIQAKIMTENTKEAYKDISNFSKLIRSVLDYSSKEYMKLSQEIEFIKNYLHLEASRFDGKIHYEVLVDSNIDTSFAMIPTLITIPFIENAIKHGLLHKDGEKNLTVSFTGDTENIEITVKDNGIGLEKSSLINQNSQKDHKSFATAATKERIKRINQSETMQIDLSINSDDAGVEVKITIQYL